MEAPASSAAGSAVRLLAQAPKRDPFVLALFSVAGFAALIGFLPWPAAGPKEALFVGLIEPLMFAIVVAAFLSGRKKIEHHERRRFQEFCAAAFATWLAASFAGHAVPESLTYSVLFPLQDALYVLFYFFLFLAAGTHPEWESGWTRHNLGHGLETVGSSVFLFGLLVYFIVLPSHFTPEEYRSLVPSTLLIAVLNLGLLWRFASLARRAECRSWKVLFSLFAATAALWTLLDLAEALMEQEILPYIPQGHPLDFFWSLPFVLIVVAARVPHLAEWRPPMETGEEAISQTKTGLSSLSAPLIVYGFAAPIIHFLAYTTGTLAEEARRVRELSIVSMLVALCTLAVIQHRFLVREARRLQNKIDEARVRLDDSARLESVGKLAAGIAHDLNNLLAVILGQTAIAEEELSRGIVDFNKLRQANQAGKRAAQLVRQLLAFGRKQPLRMVECDVNHLVNQTVEMARQIVTEDVELETDLETEPRALCLDPSQFERALMNLIVNAREAMPEGGALKITTRNIDRLEILNEEGVAYRGPGVELAVSDSGTGIPEEIQKRIFEPFFTTKPVGNGTGLGLATAYGTVRQSGGDIQVESQLGFGTTFRILLPPASKIA